LGATAVTATGCWSGVCAPAGAAAWSVTGAVFAVGATDGDAVVAMECPQEKVSDIVCRWFKPADFL
jgi:hypothetical protein